MNPISSLIVNILLLVIGLFVKKGKGIDFIAGFDKHDKNIDRIKVSNSVGLGLISISILNLAIMAIYLVSTNVFNLPINNAPTILQTIITVFGAIIIIYKTNKKSINYSKS